LLLLLQSGWKSDARGGCRERVDLRPYPAHLGIVPAARIILAATAAATTAAATTAAAATAAAATATATAAEERLLVLLLLQVARSCGDQFFTQRGQAEVCALDDVVQRARRRSNALHAWQRLQTLAAVVVVPLHTLQPCSALRAVLSSKVIAPHLISASITDTSSVVPYTSQSSSGIRL
jgi:pyruvate/2-oxoglutarate dehydrogenase complex dihydrolipoamide acyltransferase (E2) component